MKRKRLHLDYESFSLAELSSKGKTDEDGNKIPGVGAARYAADPSTEVLCAGMALDDEPPVCWHPYMEDDELKQFEPYWDALEDPEVLVYAFNAHMEIFMSEHHMEKIWGIKPPALERYRCTQSLGRRAALPSSLDQLGETLDLEVKKDKRGSALIRKFSIMQKGKKATKKKPAVPPHRIYPKDDWPAFLDFMEYCKGDVITERLATKRLAYFDDDLNNRNFTLHAIINSRGVTVNVEALRHAQRLVEEETALVGQRFRELTGFEFTQNAKLLEWLRAEGVDLPNLQAETIETFLEGLE